MTQVFRIETANGKGICSTGGLCRTYHMKDPVHQCCMMDFTTGQMWKIRKMDWDGEARFAFPSIEKLKEWFPSDRGRQAMKDNGGELVIYETDGPVIADGHQCVFDHEQARKVGSVDLVTLEVL